MANKLSITELTSSQYEAYATVNTTVKYLTALLAGAVTRATSVPGAPAENNVYIAAAGSITGAWSAFALNDLVFYLGAAWYKITPPEGMSIWVNDENAYYDFDGSSWVKRSTTTLTGGNWKVLHTNGSGIITELALPVAGQVLIGQGVAAAPIFGTLTSVVTAGNWKVFHSNGSAAVTELTIGDTGKVLRSAGTAAAPEFATAETLIASATVNLQNGDGKTDIYTVPADKKLIVTRVVIRNPSGNMTGGSDFDFGDGANADTWVNAVDLSALGTVQYRVISGDNVNYTVFDATDVFGVKPVTGATADVTATAELFGYLYNA